MNNEHAIIQNTERQSPIWACCTATSLIQHNVLLLCTPPVGWLNRSQAW